MRILFYTPLHTRCRDLESQAAAFKAQGHSIHLLTLCGKGPLHDNFSGYGHEVSFQSVDMNSGVGMIFYRWISLVAFCWRHKIDVVYAHLEPANFVAVMARLFVRARVIICRHHIDEARLYKFDKSLAYRLTYRFARTIIVVSEHARKYMMEQEGVPAHKIHVIPLAYDFNLYEKPNPEEVRKLREQTQGKLHLVDACRFTEFKRPFELLKLATLLVDRKIPFRLTILGQGDLAERLNQGIDELNLREHVVLPGYVNNVLTFLAASDLLVHPSLLESSCITVKEAGLVGLPVVVCRGVGDFDDTLTSGRDSFMVDANDFPNQAAELVDRLHKDAVPFRAAGENLRQNILSRFDISRVSSLYESFHKTS